MSTFERDDYKWRETYFVVFDEPRRPTSKKISKTLAALDRRYEIENLTTNDEGLFETLTLRSPEDYSAIDLSYVCGPEILEEGQNLAKEMEPVADDPEEAEKIDRLRNSIARFDILHFEHVEGGEDSDDMLDPSTLLLVMEVLVQLTDGVGVDPQSGTVM